MGREGRTSYLPRPRNALPITGVKVLTRVLRPILSIHSLLILAVLSPLMVFGQYQVNGSAMQTSCNCYQLTPDQPFLGGSVWNVNQIDLTESFDYTFQVFLGCSEWGADGIGFVLQPVNVTQGGGSSTLGFGGISPSLIVEVDTWPNDATMSDPQADHVAILQNGSADHGSANNLAGPVQASNTVANIEDCGWHTIRIIWDANLNSFAVFFDGTYRVSYTGDVVNTIFGGDPLVYWGWTGGTGSESADQRFCNAILPDFQVTSTSSCAGDPITFEDVSLTSSGNISDYSWNFGDGNTASGAPVTHTFTDGGDYDVVLEITTEGCTEDTIIPVTIEATPDVDLGADTAICMGETLQLNAANSLGVGTYLWTPSAGLSDAAAASPTITPTNAVSYSLTFTSANGCSATDEINVGVNPLPTADAGVDQDLCEGNDVSLPASGGVGYLWSPATGLSETDVPVPSASPTSTTTYSVEVTDANGCTDTDDVTVSVLPAPLLQVGADKAICEGDTVMLSAVGQGDILWQPATGLSSATTASPQAFPSVTTVYSVTLTDEDGCESVDSVVVDVEAVPTALFTPPDPVCDGMEMVFEDASTGPVADHMWDLGDGTTVQGTQTAHIYPDEGAYTATLTVTSFNGCTDEVSHQVEVVTGPEAAFSVIGGTDLCLGEEMELVNASSGPIIGYEWDLGDGSPTIEEEAPIHLFASEGTYAVSLTAISGVDCFTTVTDTVTVHPVPEAGFTVPLVCVGETIPFMDGSTVSTGLITEWEWSFGDGTDAIGAEPEHQYAQAGAYDVVLHSRTAAGCADSITRSVHVNPVPEVSFSVEDVCVNDPVEITNTTALNGANVSDWSWQMGNGEVATGTEPTYAFDTHGVFNVLLEAVTDSGCSASAQQMLEVHPVPQAAFAMDVTEGCAPLDVQFTNNSTIETGFSISDYQWRFDDGAESLAAQPAHTFDDSGNFSVELIASTSAGCADTVSMNGAITVFLTPEADFTYRPEQPNLALNTVTFTNRSENATVYEWSLGNSFTTEEEDPQFTYHEEGTYIITLIASDGFCTDTAVKELTVEPVTLVYIPNAFTPNGDRRNDGFAVQGVGIEGFSMSIYDRWGTELFYSSDVFSEWDGTYKGMPVKQDTYVYRILVTDVHGEEQKYIGQVTLIR